VLKVDFLPMEGNVESDKKFRRVMELNPQKEAQKILSTPRLWKEGLFPVDPITICKNLELQVVETELPEKVSGL